MYFSSSSQSLVLAGKRLATALLLGLAGTLVVAAPARAFLYTYNNTTSGTFADQTPNNAGACGAGTPFLDRTFVVNDSFNVASIAVGINVTHGRRGDVRAELFRPGSTTPLTLIVGQSGGGDTDSNYDVMISSNTDTGANTGTTAIDDNSTDPVAEPYFHRLVNLAGSDTFYTGNSVGTWTLRLCDVRANDAFEGTFNRARLVLTSTETTQVCTSTSNYQWESNGNNNAFTNATFDNITMTLTGTADVTTDASNNGGTRPSFTTQTGTFGNEAGYYIMQMDLETADNELNMLRTDWSFSPAVRDLQWTALDADNGGDPLGNGENDWEDFIRIQGFDANGALVPYTIVNNSETQRAGDVSEADSTANVADNSTVGNVTITFARAVTSVRTDYWGGDDVFSENAAAQRIGLGSPFMCAYDFGDAPTTYGAAGQVLGDRTLYMGAIPPDGEGVTPVAPNSAATTDDITMVGGIDDEDGVPSFPNALITAGGSYTVTGIVVNNATSVAVTLCGWIDFDTNAQAGDGTFEANEGSCITVPASGSNASCTSVGTTFTCSMTWTVPADYVRNNASSTYARFRVSTGALTTSSFNDVAAGAPSTNAGEVEDYQISASTLPVTIAWVDSARSGSGIELRFATATETANGGFRIWGTSAQGKRLLLDSIASQKTDSFAPLTYQTTLRGTGLAAISALEIEDLSVFGKSRVHGPFAVGSIFGDEPVADEIDWSAARAESGVVTDLDRMRWAEGAPTADEAQVQEMRNTVPPTTGGLLLVRQEGVHRVTYEQLLAARIDFSGVPAARIALVDNGAAVPRHVTAPGGLFGPGSYVEFVARPHLTLASPVDAYVLTVDPRKAIVASEVDPGRGNPAQIVAVDRYRPDQVYSFSSPSGDPWFDARLLAYGAPATLSRTFDLPDLGAGTVTLKVSLWGYGDFDGSAPDHHVIVKLNGSEIAQRAFDGLTVWEPQIDITGLATATGNTLELLVPGDTGYPFDNVAFEGFETAYQRAAVARAGRFEGTAERVRAFSIGGFAAAEPVSVWKIAGSTMTRQLSQPQSGSVLAAGGPGNVYAAAQSALYQPGIVAGLPAAQRSSAAEYLIVTHPAFANAVSDLVALEESRGLATEVVTVDRIFAAYSDYAPSAAALKSYLSASLATGNLRYVLLVGADTTDPYDHLGLGSVSYVPTDFRDVSEVVRFSPTDESLVDRQNDGLGDVPIGRLPVRTTAELDAVVAKLYAWEAAIGTGQPSALMSAGLSDGERSIATVNEAYAGSLSGWNTVLAQVDDVGSAMARQQVLDAIDAGAHVVSYVGHSSMGQWDQTPLLKWQDAADFTNAGLPNLITAWGCWNSYYVEPTIESLSARLLRQPDVGAAGTIGATTLTTESSHRQLGTLFFARVNAGAATVGEAFHGAKQDMQDLGGAADAIYGMTLLGDPAMSLPHP